jgi:tetratricopeptide (TPR) repeat protein
MKRVVAFRVLAILVALSPFVVVEIALRIAGVGRPQLADDPFVGFSATRPLFVSSDDGKRYEIAPGRLTHFRPDAFDAVKQPDELRVFCLGGSTVQGRPFSIETSFAKFVEIGLQAANPERRVKVVNCGGVSYATYRLVPILEEVLNYSPDLIIFCEGHNEFLEDRTYAEIKQSPALLTWFEEQASRLHTFALLRDAWQAKSSPTPKPTTLDAEVNARLDWRGGLDAYHRDPQWQWRCIEHFGFNILRVIALCRERGVPLVLINPAANLDWAPFKAEYRDDLSGEQLEEVERLWSEARKGYRDHRENALLLLQQATDIDDEHAGLQFDMAKCYQSLGLLPQAREVFLCAKDLDVCPLRILEPMHRIILEAAHQHGTLLVDADALFASRSPNGINGHEWFVDHVHPTIAGHQLMSDAILAKLVEQRFVIPVAMWEEDKAQRYQQHVDALPANYYPDGMKRLKSEQGWARGGAEKER